MRSWATTCEGDDDHGRADHGGEVEPGAERRAAHALQQAGLAAHDERDRERGEGVRGDAVAEEADQEEGRGVHALDRLVAVDRPDEDEQEDREEKAEEGGLPVPPEEQLLHAELVEEEPHSPSSVSSR